MDLTLAALDLDWPDVEAKIVRFISDYVERSEAKGLVLGLSGGIDSSTVAALAARAIGGENVFGLMLPEEETRDSKDVEHARIVAKKFKLKITECDITPTLEAFYRSIPIFDPSKKVSKGNVKARMRMIYLYYYANRFNILVCGSSDKSETMVGYFTKWGDVASDISPIMDLYKTQVRRLGQHIGVPEEIVKKPPSPALWPRQTAEEELGVKYELLDLILHGLEHFMTTPEIAEHLKIKKELVENVKHRWLSAEHKRRISLTTKLEYRTVGADLRLRRG